MWKRISALAPLLVAVLCFGACVLMLLGDPWRGYGLAIVFVVVLVEFPSSIKTMNRRRQLETAVEAWWRKEISESQLRNALVQKRIGRETYEGMKSELRRRFGEAFMHAFETRFGFEPKMRARTTAPLPSA